MSGLHDMHMALPKTHMNAVANFMSSLVSKSFSLKYLSQMTDLCMNSLGLALYIEQPRVVIKSIDILSYQIPSNCRFFMYFNNE